MNGIPSKAGSSSVDSKSGIKMFGTAEKNKMWKMEALMEQLRTKNNHNTKTFQELAKSMRMSLLEKRYALDIVEKAHLQKTLDSMQHCIRITTRQGLVERLESLTRQLGLKFTDNNNNLFISSDMFYLEIMLDPSTGNIQDVKVHHECNVNQESCSELVSVLQSGDFNDFTQQLGEFQSIYQLNAEPKIKSKAFVALQALEIDLFNVFSMEKKPNLQQEKLILTSSVGIVLKRRGGHPMRLLFFVRPHELLNIAQKKIETMSIEFLVQATKEKSDFGYSGTINLEAAAPANKLQLEPMLSVNQKKENGDPVFFQNGAMLPATFVLRLNKPLPTCVKLIEQIKQITDMNIFGADGTPLNVSVKELTSPNDPLGASKPVSLISLVVQLESENSCANGEKGLFVSFPDQNHCYFVSDQNEITGLLIKNIQFTEPTHVMKIVKLLRQQAVFNALISSCIRMNGKQDLENMYMFEVNAVSLNYIQIFVEHPFNESIVTVELDLCDLTQLVVKIFYGDKRITENENQMEKYAMKILQKGFSIPIMLRALIKLWEKDYRVFGNIYSYVNNYNDDQKFNLNNSLLNVDKIRKEAETDDDINSNDKTDGSDDKKDDGKNPGDKDDKKDDGKNGKDRDDDNFGNGANGNGNGSSGGPDYGSGSGGHHGSNSGGKDTTDSHNNGSNGKKSGSSGDKLLTTDPTGLFDNSNSFDICGINKNEIFFKTDQLSSPRKSYLSQSDLNQLKNKMKRRKMMKGISPEVLYIGYDMDVDDDDEDDEQEMMDVMENSSSSSSSESESSSSSNSSTSSESEKSAKESANAKKSNLIFTSKVTASSPTTQPKPLDVFEFSPSPPSNNNPATTMSTSLPTTSPNESKNSSMTSNTNSFLSTLENNRIHDIEIIPLKGSNSQQTAQGQQHGDSLLNPPTSITITPINSNYYDKGDKRSLSTSLDDKLKKKKRKREEGSDKKSSSQSSSSSSSAKKREDMKKREYSLKSPTMADKSRELMKKGSPIEGKLDSGSPKVKSNNKMKTIEDLVMDPIDANDPSMFGFTNEEKLMLMSMNVQSGQGMTVPSPLPSPQNLLAMKNRKSSLSAVIDKLKSAQSGTDEFGLGEGQPPPASPINQSNNSIQLNSSTTITPTGQKDNVAGKNTEYQVKSTASDGIKITINKTKSSSSLSGSSSPSTSSTGSKGSGSGMPTKSISSSPKHHHTGLKPGVNSGPLSKKSSQSSGSSSTSQNMSQKLLYQKSSSSGNLGSSKSSSSSSSGSQKSLQSKSSSAMKEKTKFSGSQSERSSSPYANFPYASQTEQFMKAAKTFHIPKLSARNNGGSTGSSGQKSNSSNIKTDDKFGSTSKDEQKGLPQQKTLQSSPNQSHKFNSAPTTPVQSLTPSPTGDPSKNVTNVSDLHLMSGNGGDKNKKLFKSASSEQLYGSESKKLKEDGMSKPVDLMTSVTQNNSQTQEIINNLARSGVTTTPSPAISPALAQLNDVLGDFSPSQFKAQPQEHNPPKVEMKIDERRTPTPTAAMQNPVHQKSPIPLLQYQQTPPHFNSSDMQKTPSFSPPVPQGLPEDVSSVLDPTKAIGQSTSLYDEELMDEALKSCMGNKI